MIGVIKMEDFVFDLEEYRAKKQEREEHWEQKMKEYGVEIPFNTYAECHDDVFRYMNRHSDLPYILLDFKDNFIKYPTVYQMRLLIEIWVSMELSSSTIRRAVNATIRKIYKSESKEFKKARTEIIKDNLKSLNVIKRDEKGKEYINVYRGSDHFSASPDTAISWTGNIDTAKWFANRFAHMHKDDRCCRLLQGKIYIKDILSCGLNDRNEDEVIAFPHKVFDISEVEGFIAKYDYNG